MLFDAQNLFSEKQAVTETAVSSHVVDTGFDRDLGVGGIMHVVAVPCTATGADITGTGTVKVELETSDTSNFATSSVVAASAALTVTQLNDSPVGMKMPYGTKRYLRLKYTVSGTVTGLKMYAGITPAVPHAYQYAHYMHS